MKGLLRLITAILVISMLLTACGKPAETPAEGEAALTPKEEWLKTNELGEYTAEQDWTAIEAAAKAEGTLIVYANSSKVEKAAAAVMEKYPEIKVEAYDLGGDDVLLKTVEEQKAGAFTGDVWFSSGGAEVVGNVLPNEYIWRFVPDSTAAYTPEKYTQPLLMSRFGTSVFAYNSELNDTCPISNIWELTNPEWEGKFFIEDPLNDASTLSKIVTLASYPDEMKAAYVELYGSEPVLDEDTPDAGWLWLKRFAQNGPIPEPGGDDVDSAFATPGMTESYMAFTSYSNMDPLGIYQYIFRILCSQDCELSQQYSGALGILFRIYSILCIYQYQPAADICSLLQCSAKFPSDKKYTRFSEQSLLQV